MRLLDAHAFISLPKLSAEETAALVRKLVAQVDAGAHVPAGAQETYDAMKAAGAALETPTPANQGAPKGTAVRDAHVAMQRAWGACERWLGGFTDLDDADDPRVPQAKKLYGVLFGEGLGFANTRVEVEWTLSERKINAVTKQHLAHDFDALGGRVFWSKVLAAHGVEGGAAHLTTATPKADEPSDQLAKMLTAQDAIREYVAHVIGSVRRSRPATQRTAEELLRPLAQWTSLAPSAPATPAPTPAAGATKPAGGSTPT